MRILSNCLTGLAIMLWLVTCSVSREGRSTRKQIDGNWVLETITTEGITGNIKTKIFNEAEFSCFIGSEWNFSSDKRMGTFAIVDPTKECAPSKRQIRWSVYEPKEGSREFQFQRISDKKEEMDDGAGFKLSVAQLDGKQMKLRSDIMFAGHPAAMIYNFVRK
jgi:hypothetical protein